MEKERFRKNLIEAAKSTIDFAKDKVTNQLSDTYRFIIMPDGTEPRQGLTEEENKRLVVRVKEQGLTFSLDEVVDRLWMSENVPVFIDISVYESKRDYTLLQLLTDSRLRKEDRDIYFTDGPMPPFHICLPLPPYQAPNTNKKFDINWHKKPLVLKWKMWLARIEYNRQVKKRIKKMG